MPKILCRCGNVINLSEIPSPDGFLLLPESELESPLIGISGDAWIDELVKRGKEVYECNRCHRLLIFWDNNRNDVPSFYLRE